ncbi:unnamed protein product [marine sediment metagenome]|uniref:Camelysin metallo-endopeptidase n=1 Tax=marine sediment metagenome TaxID=412755 RepID=X1KC44_9ZZZZ
MKKIIGLTIAFMLLIGMTGIGTWAYFSDVEASTGNQMTAGTLDLKTNDVDGVSQTLFVTNMAPGDTVGPETIILKNIGSVDGSTLDLAFSYDENDGSFNLVGKTKDETAAMLEVTVLNYDGSSLLGSVDDFQPNGYTDIEDLTTSDLSEQSGIGAAPASKVFEIGVTLRTETGSDFQSDGITVTMTFTLNQ